METEFEYIMSKALGTYVADFDSGRFIYSAHFLTLYPYALEHGYEPSEHIRKWFDKLDKDRQTKLLHKDR